MLNNSKGVQAETKLFIGGLPKEAKEEELLFIFEQHAEIKKIHLKRRKNLKAEKCLGHGYLQTTASDAEILLNIKHFWYKQRKITLTKYFEGEELHKYQSVLRARRLFIKNIPPEEKIADLITFFKNFGEIEVAYYRKEPGHTEDIGVIIFQQSEQANLLLKNFKNISFRNSLPQRYQNLSLSLKINDHDDIQSKNVKDFHKKGKRKRVKVDNNFRQREIHMDERRPEYRREIHRHQVRYPNNPNYYRYMAKYAQQLKLWRTKPTKKCYHLALEINENHYQSNLRMNKDHVCRLQ